MRTRLSVCARKVRYASREAALVAAAGFGLALRAYHCERCWQYHLTSRKVGAKVGAKIRGEGGYFPFGAASLPLKSHRSATGQRQHSGVRALQM